MPHESIRLGVKYSVHPLAVEDSLKLDEQQPKVGRQAAGKRDRGSSKLPS